VNLLYTHKGVCGAIYLLYIYPHAKAGKLEPAEDVAWKRWGFSIMSVLVPLAGVVRILHIVHDRHFWALPLLAMESGMLFCAGFPICIMGHLRTMSILDEKYPIVSLVVRLTHILYSFYYII
jgi:hypothetical protein